MPDPVTAIGGAQLGLGILGASSARDQARAQERAAQAGIDEQRAARESFEQRTEPFRQIGLSAAPELMSLLGLSAPQGPTAEQSARIQEIESRLRQIDQSGGQQVGDRYMAGGFGTLRGGGALAARQGGSLAARQGTDYTGERDALQSELALLQQQGSQITPAQQSSTPAMLDEVNPLVSFLRDEGFEDIQESAAARGQLRSGGTLQDLTRFNTNLAATVAPQLQQQRFNQLFNLLGIGQNAATGQGSAALQTSNNIGNLLGNVGAAQAGGIAGQNSAIQGTVGGLTELYGAHRRGLFNGGSGGSDIELRGLDFGAGSNSFGAFGDF